MKKDKLLQAGSVLFVLNMAASTLNYLCQLLLARVLSLETFGTINTIFSFMLIVAVPGTTLTMIVAKYYAGANNDIGQEKRQTYIRSELKGISILTACVFLLFIILAIPLGHLLAIDDTVVLVLSFGLASLGFYQPLYSGVFSGNRRFVWVGLYSMLIPGYKIVAVVIANFFTTNDLKRLYTVLSVMIVGTIITAMVGHRMTVSIVGKFSLFKRGQRAYLFTKEDALVLVLNICLMVYMNIDLLSVRYHETNNESGLYSAVLLFGRIIYYFSTTLGTILLPSAADKETDEQDKMRVLNKTLLVLAGFSVLCIVPINIGKQIFIQILYGEEYLAAAPFVKYVSLIAISLSVCTILVNYLVGLGRTRFAIAIMLTINIIIVLCAITYKNINNILGAIGIIGLIGAVIIYLFGIWRGGAKR